MKKIIKFEFLKIFTNKLFIFTILALILANIIIIHITNKLNENEIPNSAYKLLNMEIKDLSEEEKGDLIESEYEKNYAYNIINNIKNLENSENDYMREYSESVKQENINLYEKYIDDFENATYKYTGDIGKEFSFWEEIKNEYGESKNYTQIVKDILDKAENLETISIFKDSQDDFSSKNIKDTAKEYEKMQNTEVTFTPSKGINTFTQMGVTDIFVILLIFVIAVIIIYEEREKNLLILIKSTKNGRSKTIFSKIIVMFLYIIAISIIMYGINFIYYGISIGYGNLNASIQSINTFIYCTLQINIWQYLVLFIITKIIMLFIISLMILLISSVSRNNISSYITLIGIFGISYILYITIDPISNFNVFRVVNIINLIEVNGIFKTYTNLNILGNMQNILTLSIFFAIILLLTLGTANVYIFNTKKDLQIRENYLFKKLGKIKFFKTHINHSIFANEAFKIFVTNKVIIVLILFVVFQIYCLNHINKNISFNENIYKNYMTSLEGELTVDKEKFIQAEEEKYEQAQISITNIDKKVMNGEITQEEAERYKEPYNQILSTQEVFLKVYNQYQYIKNNPKAEFVYDTGYKDLLRVNKNSFLESDIYIIMVSIMCFTGIFIMEYRTGMIKILNTTPKGKKYTAKNKIKVCLLASLIIFAISIVPEIIKIGEIYGFSNITASITSMSEFSNLPTTISILEYIVIMYMIRFIVFDSIILFILWISFKLKNTTYTILATSSILLIPIILTQLKFEFANVISVSQMLNVSKILLSGQNLYWLYLIIPIVLGGCFYKSLCKNFGK